MDCVRWGIIGCGNVTEVKSGPAFQKASGSRLVAVMRRSAALAEDYARRHGIPRWYNNCNELIGDSEVDAVYIATPPGSHLELAAEVAAAGKPCYIEKPMARSARECDQMLAAFQRTGKPLFVAYYRRALPRFVKVAELLMDGAIGRITSCRYRMIARHNPAPPPRWRTNAAESGGGLFLDIGSHVLDLLDHLLGKFSTFGGDASSSGAQRVEDAVAMHFRTEREITGVATWNFAGSDDEELLEIEGTQGRLSTRVIAHSPIRLERRGVVETFDVPDPPHVQQPLIQSVVNELLGKGICPSTGQSAARTSVVMDAVLAGFYGGRDDAFWEHPNRWRH